MSRLDRYFESTDAKTPILDAEDLADARTDQALALEQAHSLSNELRQLIDTEAGLSKLKVAVEAHETPEADYQTLVLIASELAMAGTTAKGEWLFPSMEANYRIDTQSISNIIKKIWEIIKLTLSKIWELIIRFFKKVYHQIEPLIEQNDNMRKAMGEAATKKAASQTVRLEKNAGKLSINGVPPAEASDLLIGLNRYSQISEVIFTDYFQRLQDTGKQLTGLIQGFNLEKPAESLDAIQQIAAKFDFEAVKNGLGEMVDGEQRGRRWDGKSVTASLPLAGNKTLFFIADNAKVGEDNTLLKSQVNRSRIIKLEATDESQKDNLDKATIQTISSADGIRIYQQNTVILQQIKQFLDVQEETKRVRKALKNAGDDLEKAAKDVDGQVPENTSVYVREALLYVESFGQWALNPSADLMSQMLQAVRASIMACNASAKVYV